MNVKGGYSNLNSVIKNVQTVFREGVRELEKSYPAFNRPKKTVYMVTGDFRPSDANQIQAKLRGMGFQPLEVLPTIKLIRRYINSVRDQMDKKREKGKGGTLYDEGMDRNSAKATISAFELQ